MKEEIMSNVTGIVYVVAEDRKGFRGMLRQLERYEISGIRKSKLMLRLDVTCDRLRELIEKRDIEVGGVYYNQ